MCVFASSSCRDYAETQASTYGRLNTPGIKRVFSQFFTSFPPTPKFFRAHTCSSPRYRPLSRRLDRCDRVIHNESGEPNGGNMCSFSGAKCTSRDVTMQITFLTRKSALIYRRDLRQRVASLTLNCNGVLAIRAYSIAIIQFYRWLFV